MFMLTDADAHLLPHASHAHPLLSLAAAKITATPRSSLQSPLPKYWSSIRFEPLQPSDLFVTVFISDVEIYHITRV
jgi:hypothetical protein